VHTPILTISRPIQSQHDSVHLSDESVDVVFPVAQVTSLNEVKELARTEATGRVAELERPQEVASLLEVGADGEDLVDQILNADDVVLAKVLLDDGVVGERNALLLSGLGVSTLVDKLTDGLEVRVTVCDERLNDLEHLECRLGQAHEYTVVDLEKTQELKSLPLLRVDLVDTLDTDDEDKLRLGRDVVAALCLGDTGETDLFPLCIPVLLDVSLGTLEDLLSLLLVVLLASVALLGLLGALLLLALALLEKRFRDQDLVVRRNAPICGC